MCPAHTVPKMPVEVHTLMPVPCSHKVGPRVEGPKLVTCLHLPHLPVLLVASNPMEHEGARLEPSVTTEQKGCEECLSEGPELRRQPHPSEFRVFTCRLQASAQADTPSPQPSWPLLTAQCEPRVGTENPAVPGTSREETLRQLETKHKPQVFW